MALRKRQATFNAKKAQHGRNSNNMAKKFQKLQKFYSQTKFHPFVPFDTFESVEGNNILLPISDSSKLIEENDAVSKSILENTLVFNTSNWLEFSHEFSVHQLVPILNERKADISLNTRLESLLKIDSVDENYMILEIPMHTKHCYLPLRISFDSPFDTYLYVFNKREFFEFASEVHRYKDRYLWHELGPIGIGKSLLCYSYSNHITYLLLN
jgi:hypothetical protein